MKFDPVRNEHGIISLITKRFPAEDVVIVYYDLTGFASLAPTPGQRANLFKVFAPGVSPLAVFDVDHSRLDYSNSMPDNRYATINVTYCEYVEGEHIEKPEEVARRLQIKAFRDSIQVPEFKS
jgi:hypothetical protein